MRASLGKLLLLISSLSIYAVGQSPVSTPIRSFSSLPSTCNGGSATKPSDMVHLVTGGVRAPYTCTSPNVWTLVGGNAALSAVTGASRAGSQAIDNVRTFV